MPRHTWGETSEYVIRPITCLTQENFGNRIFLFHGNYVKTSFLEFWGYSCDVKQCLGKNILIANKFLLF